MVYSFLNVNAALVGPTGTVTFGSGAAAAEEGITIEPNTDKNVMQIGADGKGQHSLVANEAALITIKLLKTSPQNQVLQAMYNAQSFTSALWGLNVITVADSARGDITVLQSCAFKKKPVITYAKEAGMMEWTFDCVSATTTLGAGQ